MSQKNHYQIGQESSQLGMHFEPDKLLGSASYPVTQTFWKQYREQFLTSPKPVQLVIELCYHELGEWEHNTEDTDQGKQDLELAVLLVEELVKSVLERYREE